MEAGAAMNAVIVLLVLGVFLASFAAWYFYKKTKERERYGVRIETVIGAAKINFFEYDVQKDILRLSAACAELFHFPEYQENYSLTNTDGMTPEAKSYHRSLAAVLAPDGNGREMRLYRKDRTLGIFRVHSVAFNDADGKAEYVAGVLADNTDAFQNRTQFVTQAQSDELTRVYNSGAIREIVRDRLAAYDGQTVSAFLILSVDNFKKVNDEMGHQVGDQVLLMLATTLKDILRNDDYVGRLGGDEFCVYFSKVPDAQLMHSICDRINKQVKNRVVGEAITRPITVSIGCTIIKVKDSFKSVYGRADRALYLSKEKGRDTYTMDE